MHNTRLVRTRLNFSYRQEKTIVFRKQARAQGGKEGRETHCCKVISCGGTEVDGRRLYPSTTKIVVSVQ